MKSFRSVRLGKRPYRQERRVRTNGPESIHSSVPFWKTPGKTCLPTIAGASGQRAGASGQRAGTSGQRGGTSGQRGGASGAANPILSPFRSQKQKKAGGFRRLLPGIAILPLPYNPIPYISITMSFSALRMSSRIRIPSIFVPLTVMLLTPCSLPFGLLTVTLSTLPRNTFRIV